MVEHKLHDAWHKERRFHHTRGLCILAVWVVLLVLLDLLIDWLFLASYRAPGWARLVLLGLNVVTLLVVIYRYWWRHLRRYDPVRLALEFERKHPELCSLLVSYVQIDDRSLDDTHASPALVAALRREAVLATRPLNFKEVISYRMLTRLMLFSLFTVVLFAGLSVYKSDFFATLINRMLDPVSNIEYPTATVIEAVSGDLHVQQGTDLVLTARCSGELPEKGRLDVRADGGQWESVPLGHGGAGRYAHELTDVRRSFDYTVRVGDDESELHRVTVIPAPKVLEKAVTLDYPDYTGLADEQRDSYYLEVPEGTEVTWRLTMDQPLQAATMVRNYGDANAVALTVGDGGRVVEANVPARESFDYRFRWEVARHGFIYETPGIYSVNVIPDIAPEADILEPLADEKATVRKRLIVTYRASDDYGLAKAELVYSVNEGPGQAWEIGELSGREVRPTFEKRLAELIPALKEGDTVTYRIRVTDNRDDDRGPNTGESQTRRVYIVSVEEYLRSILEEQLRWFSEVEELRGEEREASEEVGELKTVESPATQPAAP